MANKSYKISSTLPQDISVGNYILSNHFGFSTDSIINTSKVSSDVKYLSSDKFSKKDPSIIKVIDVVKLPGGSGYYFSYDIEGGRDSIYIKKGKKVNRVIFVNEILRNL